MTYDVSFCVLELGGFFSRADSNSAGVSPNLRVDDINFLEFCTDLAQFLRDLLFRVSGSDRCCSNSSIVSK